MPRNDTFQTFLYVNLSVLKLECSMVSPDQNSIRLLIEAAQRYGERVAFMEGKRRLTFAGLLHQVRQTAAHFRAKGLKNGDAGFGFYTRQH
jgi:acyl-CoA synthetase (AMP-forming)/AMP-acid ligase II